MSNLDYFPWPPIPPGLGSMGLGSISAAEWRARVELAACYRLFAALGWTESIFNHITVRVPGPEDGETHYLINPFGLNYEEVTAANLVKVDLSGQAVQPTSHRVNPAGFVIHSAIHQSRSDAHCVMHTHTTAGIAVATKARGLSHDNFYGAQLIGRVAYHAFEGITVHEAEQPRLVASLADRDVLILRNHGLLTVGPDLPAAFWLLWTLQRACEVQALADSMGGPNAPVSEALAEGCRRDAAQFDAHLSQMVFQAALRRHRISIDALVGV
jgi:ribulose-5-phosphate 4-epimerase/fuculose-1-phosphate aldolase